MSLFSWHCSWAINTTCFLGDTDVTILTQGTLSLTCWYIYLLKRIENWAQNDRQNVFFTYEFSHIIMSVNERNRCETSWTSKDSFIWSPLWITFEVVKSLAGSRETVILLFFNLLIPLCSPFSPHVATSTRVDYQHDLWTNLLVIQEKMSIWVKL